MKTYLLTITYKKGDVKETYKYFNNEKEAKEAAHNAIDCMLFANHGIYIDSVSLEETH